MDSDATIRTASDDDLRLLAEHFRRMWLEIGWRPEAPREDWLAVVRVFGGRARAEREFAAFVAEANGAIVGTAACQLAFEVDPEIRQESSHRADYIWGVYTRPEYRRQGIATSLTQAALRHLKALGCARATLRAFDAGGPIHRSMGFAETNELGLPRVGSDAISDSRGDLQGAVNTPPDKALQRTSYCFADLGIW